MNIGYLNENKIIFELNKKTFNELTEHWKGIIRKIFGSI